MANYIGDMCVKTGTYEKDGQQKGRYEKVGKAFRDDQGKISFLFFAFPLCNFGQEGGVWISFFPRDNENQNKQAPQQQKPAQNQQQRQPQQQTQKPPQQNRGGSTW